MNYADIRPPMGFKDRLQRGIFANMKSNQFLTKKEIKIRGIIIIIVMLVCYYGIACLNQALHLEGVIATADGTTFYSFLWNVRLLPSWMMPSNPNELIDTAFMIGLYTPYLLFSIFWFAPVPVYRIFGLKNPTYTKLKGMISILIHILLMLLPWMLIMRASETAYLIENLTGIPNDLSDYIKFYLWGQIHPVQAILIILGIIFVFLFAILYVASFFMKRPQTNEYEYTVVSKRKLD